MKAALAAAALAALAPAGPQDAPAAPSRPARYAKRFTSQAEKLEAKLLGQATLDAISAGLQWLAEHQEEDGGWAAEREPAAATALAVLALLGDGQTAAEGRFREVVARGVARLRALQDGESGRIGATDFEHAAGTLALCEAWTLARDEALRPAAEAALAHLVARRVDGVWGEPEADVVATAWALSAASTAADGELAVPPEVFETALAWLKENTRDSGAVTRLRGSPGHRYREMASALHTRMRLGADPAREPALSSQVERLTKPSSLPEWPEEGEHCDLQYWFWAANALRLLDDRSFAGWQERQEQVLLAHQLTGGDGAGSWPPVGTAGECSGPAYATALALLCLQAPYRVVPVVRAPEVDPSTLIGIGGGKPGGAMGSRITKRSLRKMGGLGTGQVLHDAIAWLHRHQAPDGRWDADGFASNRSGENCDCSGFGEEFNDIGVTGLALLAFLGDGHTPTFGPYRESVQKGVEWLLGQLQPNGQLGRITGGPMIYGQMIGTCALVEAYSFSPSPELKERVQKAVDYVQRARNPYGGWRYDVPPSGSNDTSVTGWAVAVLHLAEREGLEVDPGCFDGALAWINEVTDPSNGRVGYDAMGSPSARVPRVNDHFPAEFGEAMTGVGLLSRFLLGLHPEEHPIMLKHADLMLRTLPEWDPEGLRSDMYYWYYGTYAMFQMGGYHWSAWNKALKEAVLDSQRRDGDCLGSWDPIGPWGHSGGRVYSTALMALCLEVYFRYPRLLDRK